MSVEKLVEHFSALEDPRCAGKVEHRLIDILVIAVCAVIACAERTSRSTVATSWAGLPDPGIPSHDTFRRVFRLIDAFEACFSAWAQSFAETFDREVVAIDGKTLRRSFGRAQGPLHLVSASEQGRPADGKSNEITAIPALLETLSLKNGIVMPWAARRRSPTGSWNEAPITCWGSTRQGVPGGEGVGTVLLTAPRRYSTPSTTVAWSAGACSSARRPESAGRLAGSVLAVESIRGVNGSGTVEIRYFLSSCHDGCWFRRSAGTGRLKMGSIGSWMSRSARMTAASGIERQLAIWPSCAKSPSTSWAGTDHPGSACGPGARKPPGMTST
jgi:hypothetical protein